MITNPTPEHREQARSFAEVQNLASRLQCTCVGERADHHAQCPVKIGTEIVAAIESLMAVEQRCGTQYVGASESEQAYQNRMRVFSLVAEPQDRFPSRWTNPPQEQTRESSGNLRTRDAAWLLVYDFEMIDCRCDQIALTAGAKANLEQRIAVALSSRDTEVREVLEGLSTLLRYTHGQPERCWCNNHNSNWTHTQECLAARDLYAKLQPR